ncbi:hypothetical protein A5821_002502 [Enterococcus sp. 7F3_DIV0205]|uniref:Beta/gamma crystallin 'Greek key' domain-containing protein n=1 Tax=Candidatus Enterococcus palustris TaxID=1834189 RepID=A0AAQ3W9T5_9ENTE|nr:beta/gamma crystallin-related protein [Enterococcus sp. 7F3_DIV0205]OTN82933.1 hypothetical protein A5821_002856 [Enterococcus sp. 7F3_DIV0205]
MKKILLTSILPLSCVIALSASYSLEVEAASANVGGVTFSNGGYTNTTNFLNTTWIYNGSKDKDGNAIRLKNDSATTVTLSSNTRVILTENQNYKGKSITIESHDGKPILPPLPPAYHYKVYNYQTVKDGNVGLSNYGFSKKTSSIIVEDLGSEPKVPVVYEHDTFGGRKQELSARNYRKKDLSFGNDRISSIRVPEGYTVQLFDDDKYKDRNYIFKGPMHVPFLEGFNDKTSSMKVTKN